MIYTILLWAGLFLLLIGAFLVWRSLDFIRHGITTEAKVVDLRVVYDSDGSDTYAPVFEYTTRTKQTIQSKYKIHSDPPTWQVGEKVNIVYDKLDPEKMKVISYFGLFRWAIITMSFGAASTVVGLGYVLFEKFFTQ